MIPGFQRKTADTIFPVKQAAVNNTAIAYVEAGEGKPVIFVHGSVGCYEDFRPQLADFSRSFRVIAYSRRYHPPNDDPCEGDVYSLQQHASDLGALIHALDANPAYLVGASYGAYICLRYVLDSPASVRSLVMAEPPILPILRDHPSHRHLFSTFRQNSIRPSLDAFKRGDVEDGVRKFLDGILGKKGAYDLLPGETRHALQRFGRELSLEFQSDFGPYMPPLARQELHKVKTPVLLLNGDRSPRMFHAITEELIRSLPNAAHQVIPASGHAMNLTNPGMYNKIVWDFLHTT